MRPLIVIPAAGASSRMRGRDKLLEKLDGLPLLRRQAVVAFGTGLPVLVTLPRGSARAEVLQGLNVQTIEVADAHEGMTASLRDGAKHLVEGQAMAVLLPDVPGIGTKDIEAVVAKFDDLGGASVVRAGQTGLNTPGTPVVMPYRIALRLIDAGADADPKSVLKDQMVHLVRFDDDRAVRDLDTPEDWAEWRAERHSG